MVSGDLLSEIAARYGVGVAPGATVTRLPVGASAQPLPVWRGNRLIYPDWKERIKAEQVSAMKRSRQARAMDAAAAARREQVAALHATGATVPQIVAATGLSDHRVRNDLAQLGLPAHRQLRDASQLIAMGQQRQAERLDRVRLLVDAGATEAAIGVDLGMVDQRSLRTLIRRVAPDFVFARKPRGPKAANALVAAANARRSHLVDLWNTVSAVDLAARFGVKIATIYRDAKILGLRRPCVSAVTGGMIAYAKAQGEARQARDVSLREAIKAGEAPEAVAARFGISLSRLRNVVGRGVLPRRLSAREQAVADRDAALMRRIEAGEALDAVARGAGMTPRALRKALANRGFAVALVSRADEIRARDAALVAGIRAAVAEGLTGQAMADRLGLPLARLYGHAHRLGESLLAEGHPRRRVKDQISVAVLERRKRVAEMYRAGATHAEMMAELGIGHSALSIDIAACGLARRNGRKVVPDEARPAFVQTVISLSAELSQRKVAVALGVSQTLVSAILRRAAAERRAA